MQLDKSSWATYDEGIKKEWLITNGIGGFACSTVIGANTRRYHGLLISSLNPPTNRMLVISNLHESLVIEGEQFDIHSYQAGGHTMEGFRHLEQVNIDPLPSFFYRVKDTFIAKKICMKHGENTVAISYDIRNGNYETTLKIAPLVNFRDYHFNTNKQDIKLNCHYQDNILKIKPHWWDGEIKLICDKGQYKPLNDCWFEGMYYAIEDERGLHPVEDHYIPGYYEIKLAPLQQIQLSVICTTEDRACRVDASELIQKEEERIRHIASLLGYDDELVRTLAIAADKHIVYRKSTDSQTIIAGYPWFTDWGRDSMIALTGLTLVTGRIKDAETVLSTFAKYEKDGLIPNMFPDSGREPAYNTVDAALWYFEAVNKYLDYGGSIYFVKQNIYEQLKNIIRGYYNGTKYNIRMDSDYLITAGDIDTQLTWMDAKVGDWTVTPRQGKAVEINALWYNALMVMERIAKALGDDGNRYREIAGYTAKSFQQKFWNEKAQCLYDCITDTGKDDKIRSNQILAVSLSFPIIEGGKAQNIVIKVMDELYTPFGLRSLSRHDKDYKGIYIGNQLQRDGAYHQGTVWTWPIGHFITAYRRANNYSDGSLKIVGEMIEFIKEHINDACIGTISEIFDGESPHKPRGCFSQAWSIAEVLRAYVEDVIRYRDKVI